MSNSSEEPVEGVVTDRAAYEVLLPVDLVLQTSSESAESAQLE